MNLYTYVGNDPINHTDPSGMVCIFKNDLCLRKKRYAKRARDPNLNTVTVFASAAATTLDSLEHTTIAGYSDNSVNWLENLSSNLEVENNKIFDKLMKGADVAGITDSQDGIDRGFVRFEQGLVQEALESLQVSDPKLYEQIIAESNQVLNSFRGTFSFSVSRTRDKIGGDIDFSNRSHREPIGYETVRTEASFSCDRGQACHAQTLTGD